MSPFWRAKSIGNNPSLLGISILKTLWFWIMYLTIERLWLIRATKKGVSPFWFFLLRISLLLSLLFAIWSKYWTISSWSFSQAVWRGDWPNISNSACWSWSLSLNNLSIACLFPFQQLEWIKILSFLFILLF